MRIEHEDTKDMIDHFGRVAKVYDRVIGIPDPAHLRQLLQLPIQGWLLDGGGGTGRVSGQLSAMVGNVVVNDLSHRMLKQAHAKPVFPVCSVAEQLPFADNSFERILVVDALHHFFHQRDAIRDLIRVLKPGGRMVIEEPDYNLKLVKMLALAEKMFLMRSHFISPERIREMVAGCGASATIIKMDNFRAWIVADKSGEAK
jgi:demethylmenaquinone methyltransferase/2-methoxy-6-polyprenyl-1,4-benzoquinol methylase